MISKGLSQYLDWATTQHGEYYKKRREADVFLRGLKADMMDALVSFYREYIGYTALAYDSDEYPVEALIVDVEKSKWGSYVGVTITVLFNPDDLTPGLSLTEKEKKLVAKLKKVYQEVKAKPWLFNPKNKEDYFALEGLKNELSLCLGFVYAWYDEDLAQGSLHPDKLNMDFRSAKCDYQMKFSDFKKTTSNND